LKTLHEILKQDVALAPQSLATTNVTSPYFDLSGYDSATFILTAAVMAAAATAKLEVFGAAIAGGSGGALIADHTATITSPTKVTIGYIHVNTPDNDDTVTVNGIVFTKKASVDATAQEFTNIAELVSQINTYVDGVTAAVDNTNYVILTSTDPGKTAITLATTDAAKLVVSSLAGVAVVQVLATAGKRYVAAKVTTVGTIICAVDVIRGHARNLPVTQVTAAQYPA
jgi:hypothetical protein